MRFPEFIDDVSKNYPKLLFFSGLAGFALACASLVLEISDCSKFRPVLATLEKPEKEKPENLPAIKTISFEQFRLISIGDSETKILSRLGEPYRLTPNSPNWIYNRDDGFVVTLTIVNGKVFSIRDEKV